MNIAMIGTRGVPARYGGFETAVEEIGARLADAGHEITVYSRVRGPSHYRGMRVVYLPTLRTKYTDTLVHGILSIGAAALARPDTAIVFNAANAPAATLLRLARIPYAIHLDGLEWQRAKWSGIARRYYLAAESIAVRTADALIADARGIAAYYRERYDASTTFIAYGAPEPLTSGAARIQELGLASSGYHLVVARLEPENHVREILDGYVRSAARLPLVVVGDAPYANAYRRVVEAAARDDRVRLLGSIWDQELLDALYVGCATYLHGHSVGGTNPSLLRAAGAGAPCIAWDVSFTREVLGADGTYFASAAELPSLIDAAEHDPAASAARGERARERVVARYRWDAVASDYETLCLDLVSQRARRIAAAPPEEA